MFLSIGRLGATTCKVVDSSTYPKSTTDKWKTIPAGTSSPYYDATCKCWAVGYKPTQDLVLYGVTPSSGSMYWQGSTWSVCVPPPATTTAPATTAPATATCPTCPVCKNCPSCPTCPKCPACPATPSCPPPVVCPHCDACPTCPSAATDLVGKYGPTLGLLLAALIVGGGGYYAYKKGAFGKRK
jgi:hypothetical protein